jgi:hypothetical protein
MLFQIEFENRFLKVTYANGDKEVLYFKDFNSGVEDRVHLVEEHDHRHSLAGLLPARWNISRMCRSVSPTYLFNSSGPLMFKKKLLPSLACPAAAASGSALACSPVRASPTCWPCADN